jgi:hypothetical protein
MGYWKEGDGIHTDYDTLALRDVAKLYAKYDELYKAQRKPLTDGELFKLWVSVPAETEDRFAFARAIEAAHGIKGDT